MHTTDVKENLKRNDGQKIKDETTLSVVLGDFLYVTDDGVSFLVLVLLEKAEDEVQEKQTLNNDYLKVDNILVLIRTKCCLKCLTEYVFTRSKDHDDIKCSFPLAVYLDHQLLYEMTSRVGAYNYLLLR